MQRLGSIWKWTRLLWAGKCPEFYPEARWQVTPVLHDAGRRCALLGQSLHMHVLLCLALDSRGMECTPGRCRTLCLETSSLGITIKNIFLFDVGSYDLKLFGSSKPLASASWEAGTPASPTTQSLRNPHILQQTVSKFPWPWPRGIAHLCNAAQQTNSFSPREMLSVSWGLYSANILEKEKPDWELPALPTRCVKWARTLAPCSLYLSLGFLWAKSDFILLQHSFSMCLCTYCH